MREHDYKEERTDGLADNRQNSCARDVDVERPWEKSQNKGEGKHIVFVEELYLRKLNSLLNVLDGRHLSLQNARRWTEELRTIAPLPQQQALGTPQRLDHVCSLTSNWSSKP